MDPRGPVARNALPGGNVRDSQDPHFATKPSAGGATRTGRPFAAADVIEAAESRIVFEHP